jgi:hypothetical protein
MQIRGFATVVAFATAFFVTAAHVPPAHGHAGNNNPGVIHACVGSFGGIRIVGVNGTCAATEAPLHLNTVDRPTTFAAQQTAEVILTVPNARVGRVIETQLVLNSPAIVDFKLDGVVSLEGNSAICTVAFSVNFADVAFRTLIKTQAGVQRENWTMQANGVELPAGAHSIVLTLINQGASAGDVCVQNAEEENRAKLWALIR